MTGTDPFGPQQAFSVFEAMRPEPGVTVDRLVCLTYSLDLVAVAAMLISMTGRVDDELSGGPMCLVDALETFGSRLSILHQKGRLQVAKRHFGILHLFDGFLHAVTPRPGSSWHPKCVLGRYTRDGRPDHWRLWIGSRNLTVGADREAGLTLRGVRAPKGKRNVDLVDMIRTLSGPVGWKKPLVDELAELRWEAPRGTRLRDVHWRKLGERKPFVEPFAKPRRTLVISPFVNESGLLALGSVPIELLTIEPTAKALGEIDGVTTRLAASPRPDEPATVAERDETSAAEVPEAPTFSGLHAKIILQRGGRARRLWIGSANATGRGLVSGNVEIVAELDIDETIAGSLEAFAETHALAQIGDSSLEEQQLEAAERALDEALQSVLEAEFEIVRRQDQLELTTAGNLDGFTARHRLECWLFTSPQRVAEWYQRDERVVLVDGPTPPRMETFLVGFRATSREDPRIKRTWAQKVAFPDLDVPARDRAALAAYIGGTNIAAWLRARLQGITPVETKTWAGGDRPGSTRAPSDGPPGAVDFALEEVLSAWARNPKQFEERAVAISELLEGFAADFAERDDEEGADARRQLTEVEAFWSAVRDCLGRGRGRGA